MKKLVVICLGFAVFTGVAVSADTDLFPNENGMSATSLDRLGLKNGEVIRSVEGSEARDPGSAFQKPEQLDDKPSRLRVYREGVDTNSMENADSVSGGSGSSIE